MNKLDEKVQYVKGVGEKKAKLLEKLGVTTVRELVGYFPRAYEDRRVLHRVAEAPLDRPVCIKAMVANTPTNARIRGNRETVRFRAVDESGSMDVTYFNQTYLKDVFKPGRYYIFYGTVTLLHNRRYMTNPEYEPEDQQGLVTGRILPVYRLTTGLGRKSLLSIMQNALEICGEDFPNALPEPVREKIGLAQSRFCYHNIHFPEDDGALQLARERLVFEELFVLAAALGLMRSRRGQVAGVRFGNCDMQPFWSSLPFAPTGAQRRAVNEAVADMTGGECMNRLLQGDVGSGKTLVAAALIWLCAQNGCQAAFMAPTEILADQHFANLSNMLAPFGIQTVKLTGSMTAREKREAVGLLTSGAAKLAVGTHALLSDAVAFDRLALVITDEQHRFGVDQRGALSAKGERPHVLVMSATPIPRTLALIIYGDLDVSVLDELPPGRQKVDTFAVGEDMRERIRRFVLRLVGEGRQVFWVCPMVEENEELPPNVKAAEQYAKHLQTKVFPELRVCCIHGRMKPKEKDAAMAAFAAGEYDILVSTTVIEVGVDIPNAALMIVENADRFGLSQLHQLRGRVGRGEHKSYCVLFSDAESDEARARLRVLCKTNDGFKISEEDLRLRGPGDFFGSRQHGLPEMHVADLAGDMRVLNRAQTEAQTLLRDDPELQRPENRPLRQRVDALLAANAERFN